MFQRLRWFLDRKKRETDMEREFQAHLEEEIQEQMESGIPLEEATAAAHRTFGNKAQVMEEARTAWRWSAFESVLQDAKFAFRSLTKTPAFTATAVLTLALGISANTAILSVINVVLVRPLPYKDSDRYVRIIENRLTSVIRSGPGGAFTADTTFERSSDLNSAYLPIIGGATRTLESVAAYSDVYILSKSTMTATGSDQPIRLAGKRVSPSLFSMLGVKPLLGRVFETHDRAIILSYRSWQRDFHGERNILERTLIMDDTAYSVVAVMPRDFEFPNRNVDFWIPLIPRDWASDIGAQASLIAKLKDGVTIKTAAAETAAAVPAGRLPRAWHADHGGARARGADRARGHQQRGRRGRPRGHRRADAAAAAGYPYAAAGLGGQPGLPASRAGRAGVGGGRRARPVGPRPPPVAADRHGRSDQPGRPRPAGDRA